MQCISCPVSNGYPLFNYSSRACVSVPLHAQLLLIIAMMAPQDVLQCISRPAPDGYPDILPTVLESDPATWPAAPPPQPAIADGQPQWSIFIQWGAADVNNSVPFLMVQCRLCAWTCVCTILSEERMCRNVYFHVWVHCGNVWVRICAA